MKGNNIGNRKDIVDERFRNVVQLFMLGATPLYPINGSFVYEFYCVLLVVCGYVTPLMMVIGTVENMDDISYVMESVRPCITIFSCLWMHIFIRFKMRGLRKLMSIAKDFTWSDTPTSEMSSGSNANARKILLVQRVAFRIHVTLMVCHASHLIVRMATNTDNTLYFNTWIPFGDKTKLAYGVVLIVQALGSWMYSSILCAILGLYAALVIVCCTQLEKIQTGLLKLKQGENEPQSAIKNRLAECVNHHQKVIRFMNILDDTFHLVILGSFVFVAAGLCFVGYAVVTISENLTETVQTLMILTVLMLQLQIFCWFGNEITEQSAQVRDAAWSSDWVGTPIHHQKSMNFVMTASKGFILNAGKIIPVSRRTMLLVLNQTCSYFMILLNFMNKSSEEI